MSIGARTVNVSGLNLNAIDAPGNLWVMSKLSGWDDGPGIAVVQLSRINSHGQTPQVGRRIGRTITVEGWVKSASRAQTVLVRQQLAGTLADGRYGAFTVTDPDVGVWWTNVQLLATPNIDTSHSYKTAFQLQFLAPSSYRFGAVSSATVGFAAVAAGSGMVFDMFPGGVMDFGVLGSIGQATVANNGNAPASVVFSITGPIPAAGFRITDTTTGKRITYLGSLPASSVLVIDGSVGSVVIDGTADRFGDTIVEAWPTVPANGSKTFLFEGVGGTTASMLTVSTTSTYW